MRFVRREAIKFLLAGIAVAGLAGCGFQLRGATRVPYSSVYVQSPDPESPLVRRLGQTLQENAVQPGARAEDADAVLVLSREGRNRTILALSGGGRVREYRLNYTVSYSLNDRDGNPIYPESTIKLTRDFTYDDNLYLAKTAEEGLLYRDLEEDAVQQIMRRLRTSR
jgi:LPS-assembly lipoprotein